MIKLDTIRSDKIWGYENWIASTHPNGMQKEFYDFAGGDYPLLVKVIQADDTLSVQVHPNDEVAERLENCRGKTECWYVLSARKGAQLVYGLDDVYSPDELRKAIEDENLEDMLFYADVHAGDFIYIPAGTVHAIGGGLRLLEVQQSSDITYRLYDWGRGRECHVEKGIACIDESGIQDIAPFDGNFECEYFSLEKISCEGSYESSVDGADAVLYFVLDGSGKINGYDAEKEDIFAFKKGEVLKAEGSIILMKILPNL
ncbi:type I phosphomannose isomerase catalytic subunit [Treponema sp.]|uniref:type I phosphomannose isomerase catalytic subunit n=1 Tax=Treponema sp. TaxID=166 RepID=UPI00388E4FBA